MPNDQVMAASGATPAVMDKTAAAVAGTVVPPNNTEMMLWNVGFIVVLVIMFYLLLIRPQQSRYREHADMLKGLHKGDKVVLQSGMIVTIDKIDSDSQEVQVTLSEGHKATVLRSAIAGKYTDIIKK